MVTLEESFEHCRRLNKRWGTTYYWATAVLPPVKRPYVHALYGFCRYADDIVDRAGSASPDRRRAALGALGERFFADLAAGRSDDRVLKAVVHTVKAFDLDPDCFRRFLRSMTMDLSVNAYETFDDLLDYMDGSAAVIGELMLPVLEPSSPEALGPARDLGIAFQLTNFIRDVGEDLDRGRVYLPQEDVRKFEAEEGLARRLATPGFCRLVEFEIERARRFYASADTGICLLPSRSARCVRAARALYGGILDRIEAAGCDVFSARARVPTWRKVAAGVSLLRF